MNQGLAFSGIELIEKTQVPGVMVRLFQEALESITDGDTGRSSESYRDYEHHEQFHNITGNDCFEDVDNPIERALLLDRFRKTIVKGVAERPPIVGIGFDLIKVGIARDPS